MTSAEAMGARLLGEVETETLESLLVRLQTHPQSRANDSGNANDNDNDTSIPDRLGLPALDQLWHAHSQTHGAGPLQLTGRYLPQLYHIISVAVSAPRHGCVLLVDLSGKFDVARLHCSREDLEHVYVLSPALAPELGVEERTGAVRRAVEDGERWLRYTGGEGGRGSADRPLVLKIVSGAGAESAGVGADVVAGWRGWMRVEWVGEEVRGVGAGGSVEEALGEREMRMGVLEGKGWRARGGEGEGGYMWTE